jgi:phage tail sheath gpL-like
MRKFLVLALIALGAVAVAVPAAWAGNPHFVSVTAERTGNTLTVEGKEAGLGSESAVFIEVRATAECINNGGKHPKAENKESVSAEGEFPVQNGKAEFSLTLTASFKPACSPPMELRFSNVIVEDTTNGISKKLGSF